MRCLRYDRIKYYRYTFNITITYFAERNKLLLVNFHSDLERTACRPKGGIRPVQEGRFGEKIQALPTLKVAVPLLAFFLASCGLLQRSRLSQQQLPQFLDRINNGCGFVGFQFFPGAVAVGDSDHIQAVRFGAHDVELPIPNHHFILWAAFQAF